MNNTGNDHPKVFFTKASSDMRQDIESLFDLVSADTISRGDSVAIKMHFGEPGNNAYLKPKNVKPVIDKVLKIGGVPFLTDANTLYKGGRSDTAAHLNTAKQHGYSKDLIGADVVIADGPDSHDVVNVQIGLKHFKQASLAAAAFRANSMVVLTHFKGHECTGFGGSIKNIGMGLGSKAGKQQMHADVKPQVDIDTCTGCGECSKWCPADAITYSNGKAQIDLGKCIGCGECIAVCPTSAIAISWGGSTDSVQEKMAEYAYAVLSNKRGKISFINFIIDISPNCDCYPKNDPPIAPDIGIVASNDIVAVDAASADLVNASAGRITGKDKFKTLYNYLDWNTQLDYAQSLGLGNRKYQLINI